MIRRLQVCPDCKSVYSHESVKWYQFWKRTPCPVCKATSKQNKHTGPGMADQFNTTPEAMAGAQEDLKRRQAGVGKQLNPFITLSIGKKPGEVVRAKGKATVLLNSCGSCPVHSTLVLSLALQGAIAQLVDAGEKEAWLEKQLKDIGK